MTTLDLSIVVQALDRASQPLRKIGQVAERIAAPTRRLGQALAALGRKLDLKRLAGDLGRLTGALGRVGREAAKLGLKAAAGLGAAAFAFNRLLIGPAAEFERFESILTTLTGSSSKAKDALKWISAFAAKTPYELAEVTDAFVRLRSYGIDATDGTLKAVGDAAAARNQALEDVVEALADARRGDFKRMESAFGLVAETGSREIKISFKTPDGEDKDLKANKRNAADLQAMVLEFWRLMKFEGAMENLSKTWDGMVSNLLDAWTRFRVAVMASGPFEFLKARLKGLLDKIDAMAADGRLAAWAERVGAALLTVFTAVERFFLGVEGAAGPTPFERFLEGARDVWRVVRWLGETFGWTTLIIAGLAGTLGGSLISAIAPLLPLIFRLGAALLATPVGWVILGLGAAAAAAWLLYDNWSAVVDAVKPLWTGLANFIETALERPKASLQAFLARFEGLDLAGAGRRLMQSFKEGLLGAWDEVTATLAGLLDELTEWLPEWAREPLGLSFGASAGSPGLARQLMGAAAPQGERQQLRNELVIRGENLPPGMTIEPRRVEADSLDLSLGYAMAVP